MTHFNGLTPAQTDMLARLAEECGEAIHAVGKILRRGFDAPYGSTTTGRGKLERELGDISAIVNALIDAGDLSREEIMIRSDYKAAQHQVDLHIAKRLEEAREGAEGSSRPKGDSPPHENAKEAA